MSVSPPPCTSLSFTDLSLGRPLLRGLAKSGYTTPTPIQSRMIPHLLAGRDVIGQAQTGTGKTAAFALPLLQNLAFSAKATPQILVLSPTRELAMQVSTSFSRYGSELTQLRVLPIYGGQEYASQLRGLQRGAHVIVGTPGRIIDHLQRRSLDLSSVGSVVLDEADEMLKMGFLADVERILGEIPEKRQTALFSATMPASIRRLASRYLNEPVEITIEETAASTPKIEQHYLITNGIKAKKNALETLLEAQSFDGMLVFVRTKLQTVELAEHLSSRGYSCGALNGDIVQSQRARMVAQLKDGKLDILIATDVAARGLDVQRISHVINFDAPYDCEAYIHRIGRTGRAGRKGKALLFLHPQEKKMLHALKKQTGEAPALMKLPTPSEINALKREAFKLSISVALEEEGSFFSDLIDEYCREHDVAPHLVAGALAKMCHEKTPLFIDKQQEETHRNHGSARPADSQARHRLPRNSTTRPQKPQTTPPEQGMDRYRIEIGESHGIKPGNIVGAIANEADISSQYIGRISIFNEYSTVDLPYGMPPRTLSHLQKARVGSRMLRIRKETTPLREKASAAQKSIKDKVPSPRLHKSTPGLAAKKAGKSLHL